MSTNNDLQELFNKSSSYSSISPQFQNGIDDNDNIAFSFQYLQKDYNLDNKKLQKDQKIQLLKKIVHISKCTWTELVLQNKKSGFEKVNKTIIPNLPTIITDDIKNLYILRFSSQECRVIGFRQGVIYYILYIDPELKLYKHN